VRVGFIVLMNAGKLLVGENNLNKVHDVMDDILKAQNEIEGLLKTLVDLHVQKKCIKNNDFDEIVNLYQIHVVKAAIFSACAFIALRREKLIAE